MGRPPGSAPYSGWWHEVTRPSPRSGGWRKGSRTSIASRSLTPMYLRVRAPYSDDFSRPCSRATSSRLSDLTLDFSYFRVADQTEARIEACAETSKADEEIKALHMDTLTHFYR